MTKKLLGLTSFNISHLCLGLEGANVRHLLPMLHSAVTHGINWWDFRLNVHFEAVHQVLHTQSRKSLVLSAHSDARTGQELLESVQHHLTTLRIDYLDILFLDNVRNLADREARKDAVDALREVKAQGLVRATGMRSNDPALIRHSGEQAEFDVLMVSMQDEQSLKGDMQSQLDMAIRTAHLAGRGVVLTDMLSSRAGRHDPFGLLEWAVNIPTAQSLRFAPTSAAELQALVRFFADRRVDPENLKFLWGSAA